MEEKGEIYLSKYSGWYSVSDEAFYLEDEIEEKDGVKISKSSGSVLGDILGKALDEDKDTKAE